MLIDQHNLLLCADASNAGLDQSVVQNPLECSQICKQMASEYTQFLALLKWPDILCAHEYPVSPNRGCMTTAARQTTYNGPPRMREGEAGN